MKFLDDYFTFILPSDDEDHSLTAVMELARHCVYRDGIKGLIVDPWNELDHSRPPGLTETEYISQCLSRLRKFARTYQVHVWLVAHPVKMRRDESGAFPIPTPYDVSGSAHWKNKADNCLAVYRKSFKDIEGSTLIAVQKIRFRETGRVGEAYLKYDYFSGRYRSA